MRSDCRAQGTIPNLLGWNMMENSMRKKKVCIYVCMSGSLCCAVEIETILQINLTLKNQYITHDLVRTETDKDCIELE